MAMTWALIQSLFYLKGGFMLVKLYVYQKSDGLFLYQDIGNPNYVITDLGDDKDFTLTAPPDDTKQWCWQNGQWI